MRHEDTEYISCPNCGKDDAHVWARENGFSAMKCKGCALIYVNPRPSAAAISEANRLGVHNTDRGQLVVTSQFRPWKVWKYSRMVKALFSEELSRSASVRWLDVGAGHGEFVLAVQKLLPPGSSVVGIEPMERKVKAAQTRGLNVTNTSLSELKSDFDVISLINVFSHIPDFKGFLKLIRDKMVPGGVILIETGNAADLSDRKEYPGRLDLPDHLVFSGIDQMKCLLNSSGFVLDKHLERKMTGFGWAAKQSIGSILKGHPSLTLPGKYAFRMVFFKARLAN